MENRYELKIAVCDDNEKELCETAEMVENYLKEECNVNGQIQMFRDGRELLSKIETTGVFDIYILDILMPELNGIETGKKLRNLGDGGEIVYLTGSNDFAVDSYDVRAFFYLLKPVDKNKLFQVLDGAIEKLNKRRSSAIIINTAGGIYRILLEDIYYAEMAGRRIRYHCKEGVIESQTVRTSFKKNVELLLEKKEFYLCGASFAVNFQHVTSVKGQNVQLDNGQTIVLPRTSASSFKLAWGNYWLEGE